MKANTYRLKHGTTMQDILSLPGASKGSASHVREGTDAYLNKSFYKTMRVTMHDDDASSTWTEKREYEISIIIAFDSSNLESWNDFDNVLVLDEDFCQPYTPFHGDNYKKEVSDFPFLEWVISEYNALFDSLPVFEKAPD